MDVRIVETASSRSLLLRSWTMSVSHGEEQRALYGASE